LSLVGPKGEKLRGLRRGYQREESFPEKDIEVIEKQHQNRIAGGKLLKKRRCLQTKGKTPLSNAGKKNSCLKTIPLSGGDKDARRGGNPATGGLFSLGRRTAREKELNINGSGGELQIKKKRGLNPALLSEDKSQRAR